jgi:hypothetical protein
VTTLLAGIIAQTGILSQGVLITLFAFTFLAEIIIIFSRNSKLSNNYLKPATFYSFATIFGGLFGQLFLAATNQERKM